MAAVRYCLDEHIAEAVATWLRRRGIEALTRTEAEMLGASDEEHFAFAREENGAIVTHDDDFLRLAAQTADPAGVVYLPQRRSIGETVRGLALIADVLDAEDMRGHVEFLCVRLRPLRKYNHALLRNLGGYPTRGSTSLPK